MSRRHRQRHGSAPSALFGRPVVLAEKAEPEPPIKLGTFGPQRIQMVTPEAGHDGPVLATSRAPEGCTREIVHHDSLFWRCACGGSGRVGRSKDGIPYVNEEILAHVPGEQRS